MGALSIDDETKTIGQKAPWTGDRSLNVEDCLISRGTGHEAKDEENENQRCKLCKTENI